MSPSTEVLTDVVRAAAWEALPGPGLTVLHPPGAEADAVHVASLLPPLREAVAAAFDAPASDDLVLWVYPNREALLADDPLAVAVGEDILRGRRSRDLVLALPGLADRASNELAIAEALRFELVHRQLESRSAGRLPPLLAEGIAIFMRPPREGQAGGIAALREARERGALPTWSQLMAPGAQYENTQLKLPAVVSLLHFLVEAEGWQAVLGITSAVAEASGWREGFERGVGRPPDQLESAWEDWLPGYLDGGWRRHPLYPDDLRRAERLLAVGRYDQARRELGALLAVAPDGPLAAEARQLETRARDGARTGALLDETVALLDAGDYDAAMDSASSADQASGGARLPAAGAAARELTQRAQLGARADAALMRARSLPPWRLLARRQAAHAAYDGYGALGDGLALAEAAGHLRRAEGMLAAWGVLPLVAGMALAISIRRKRSRAEAL